MDRVAGAGSDHPPGNSLGFGRVGIEPSSASESTFPFTLKMSFLSSSDSSAISTSESRGIDPVAIRTASAIFFSERAGSQAR